MPHKAEHRILHQIQRFLAIGGGQFGHAQGPALDAFEKLLERMLVYGGVHALAVPACW